MSADVPPAVPKVAFAACLAVINALETDAARVALLAGLVGYFLSSVPWEVEAKYSEVITRLAHEAAAVARNGESAGNE